MVDPRDVGDKCSVSKFNQLCVEQDECPYNASVAALHKWNKKCEYVPEDAVKII